MAVSRQTVASHQAQFEADVLVDLVGPGVHGVQRPQQPDALLDDAARRRRRQRDASATPLPDFLQKALVAEVRSVHSVEKGRFSVDIKLGIIIIISNLIMVSRSWDKTICHIYPNQCSLSRGSRYWQSFCKKMLLMVKMQSKFLN
jgi:hypothetical protein